MAKNFARIVSGLLLLGLGGLAGWGFGQWRMAHSSEDGHAAAPVASAPASERKVLYWYDPMVPTQRFDKPGKSPFMEMQLVPRYADGGEPASGQTGTLAVSTQAQQALGLRLATVQRQTIGTAVETVGSVQLNDRDVSIVQARSAGFVERVYARAPGDVVARGAPLVDLLVPEWLGAQLEFLAVKGTADAALTQAARSRLVLLGMPAALIERAEQSGQPIAVHTIAAPSGGVITELMVRQGMSVAPGMTLARINGLSTVWLEAALPESLAATIRPGQAVEARFPALPGEVVKGKVAAVLPEANRDTRTLRLRIELPNPGQRLKAGLFAQVSLRGSAREALVVPAEAVIRTGRRALVYVAEEAGRYRPVPVEIGEQVDEWIVIRSGLTDGQQVVASGQFLVDSEASLKGVEARLNSQSAPNAAANAMRHAGQGLIESLDRSSVTLSHGPLPSIGMGAMTMEFKLPPPDKLPRGLAVGDRVDFEFYLDADGPQLTRIARASVAPAPVTPGASR